MSLDAQQLWREIGKPEAVQATPEQLLAFMRLCDDDDGLELAGRMLESAGRAADCFVMGHDSLQEQLRWTRHCLAEANRKLDAQ